METIINKLTEIETAASAIVTHAEQQKEEMDREYEERRKEFDQDLEKKTMQKIQKIQEELEWDKKRLWEGQEDASSEMILSLQREYNTKHTAYAAEILKRITEV